MYTKKIGQRQMDKKKGGNGGGKHKPTSRKKARKAKGGRKLKKGGGQRTGEELVYPVLWVRVTRRLGTQSGQTCRGVKGDQLLCLQGGGEGTDPSQKNSRDHIRLRKGLIAETEVANEGGWKKN